ncbi:MAG TPA: hypothetical protein VEV84_11670 [Pyrinomonadaceae bacterium]|nr:hypothetical protein [Pyrinomonadaceae bacterium]
MPAKSDRSYQECENREKENWQKNKIGKDDVLTEDRYRQLKETQGGDEYI